MRNIVKILSGISHGRAMAYDGITDDILTKQKINKSAKVFRDLWTTKWKEYIEKEEHFPRLTEYMVRSMHRGQTGFVKGQGILMN